MAREQLAISGDQERLPGEQLAISGEQERVAREQLPISREEKRVAREQLGEAALRLVSPHFGREKSWTPTWPEPERATMSTL